MKTKKTLRIFLSAIPIPSPLTVRKIEFFYNYNKNTINSMTSSPNIHFKFNFSSLSVEYIEGTENFLEFMTYLFGIVGGIVALIRFINNLIHGWFMPKEDYNQIPQSV